MRKWCNNLNFISNIYEELEFHSNIIYKEEECIRDHKKYWKSIQIIDKCYSQVERLNLSHFKMTRWILINFF